MYQDFISKPLLKASGVRELAQDSAAVDDAEDSTFFHCIYLFMFYISLARSS